jgi:hypothetical protein
MTFNEDLHFNKHIRVFHMRPFNEKLPYFSFSIKGVVPIKLDDAKFDIGLNGHGKSGH